MFKIISLLFVATFAQANANETTEGLLYLSGLKGAYTETLLMPNCPYEKCDEVAGDQDKGANRMIYVQKKDLKTATKLLSKSVYNLKDPIAAEAILKHLKKAVNWKDTKPEKFLIESLYKDFGLTKKQYDALFVASVDLLRKNKKCDGYVTKAEMYKHGVFGLQQSQPLAKKEWQAALSVCQKNSYEYMMASSAMPNH